MSVSQNCAYITYSVKTCFFLNLSVANGAQTELQTELKTDRQTESIVEEHRS